MCLKINSFNHITVNGKVGQLKHLLANNFKHSQKGIKSFQVFAVLAAYIFMHSFHHFYTLFNFLKLLLA